MKKTVFVIGASGGIGDAVCREFAKENYNIVATYFNNELNNLESYCKEFTTLTKFKLDVCDMQNIKSVFEKVFKDNLYIESVINCTGISLPEKLLIDETNENIDKIIDINLKGAIYLSREAMKYLSKQKHGSIINISSIYGKYGGSCEAVYSATKGAINALTKSLAQECASFNVRVNAVAPGYIATNMTKRYSENEKKDIIAATPLNRLGQPDDVAKVIKFLASESASFITGEVIQVSGGADKY